MMRVEVTARAANETRARLSGPKVVKTVPPNRLNLDQLSDEMAAQVRKALAASPAVKAGSQVFLLEDWEPWHEGNLFLHSIRAKAEGTREVYASTVRMWVDYTLEAAIPPTKLNLDTLLEYRDAIRLEEECGASTWNNQLSHLKAAANAWAAQGLMKMPPNSIWSDLRVTDTSIGWPRVVEQDDYVRFRFALQGLNLEGGQAMREPLRTAMRDVLYSDFLLLHGTRRAEAAHLTLLELPPYTPRVACSPLDAAALPAIICKWGSGRNYQVHRRWAERLKTYHNTEWFQTIERAQRALRRRDDLLIVCDVLNRWSPGEVRIVIEGGNASGLPLVNVSKERRRRLVMRGELAQRLGREQGMGDQLQTVPSDWLVSLAIFPGTRTPMPVPESWGHTFREANERVRWLVQGREGPEPRRVTPHKLRHSFAVNWLQTRMDLIADEDREVAIHRANGDAARLRRRFANPLLSLKQVLGHRSLDTTLIYLRYVTEREDHTIIEEPSWIEHFLGTET